MNHKENIKIIAFVGLAGAGKSSAIKHLTNQGYPKVYFGGVVLNAMIEAGLDQTPKNEQHFREELRIREGKDFVVNNVIKQIHNLINTGQHRIVADGLYTWTEYKILKSEFPNGLSVVAVVAPRQVRHHRLSIRSVRPLTETAANQRDWAEIENLEKGGPIAIADYFLINDSGLKKFNSQIDQVIEHIKF